MEISGRMYRINDLQKGEGKNGTWLKQEFIIETEEQFPKKVCLHCWGDKVNVLKTLKEGDKVSISFNVESREFNNRWYTDLRAWKIDKMSGNAKDDDYGDIPEHALPPRDEPPIDDLPF